MLTATEVRLQAAETLEKAADLYRSETVNWCQDAWVDRGDEGQKLSVCAEGALLLASGFTLEEIDRLSDNGVANFAKKYRWEAARHQLFVHLRRAIHDWNDVEGRTKEEVIDAMEATAKDLRNGQ